MQETVPNSTRRRDIDSWAIHDLQFSYVFNVYNGLRASVGVDNLFDENPPFAASAFNDNFDGSMHNLYGLYWYLRIVNRF